MQVPFEVGDSAHPVIPTAVHAGHDLRPETAHLAAADHAARRREEDPFTDRVAAACGTPVIVHRSRFEVDVNRARARAVYRKPEDAWGIEVWSEPLPDAIVERSLAIYDAFYAALAERLDALARHGPFVVLDLHSYNHRRDGPQAPTSPSSENPEVNVGTGTLDRSRWGGLVDRFIADLSARQVAGHRLDVRENVRFTGGELSHWIHRRYPGVGCALAIELKKTFMDEWTGTLDEEHLGEVTAALAATVPNIVSELGGAA